MIRLLLTDVLPLEDPAVYASLYDMASSERRRAADSFRFMKDRRLSIGASALLDAGLREFGLRERDMTYGRSEHGKPFFMNATDIHFNISHSGTKVAVVFSDREVGCDIEEAFAATLPAKSAEQEAAKCLEMAGRFFSRQEYLAVKAVDSPSERVRTFYRCWTLKESYMKATGLGMALAPDSFSVAALCTDETGSLLRHSGSLDSLSSGNLDIGAVGRYGGDMGCVADGCAGGDTGCAVGGEMGPHDGFVFYTLDSFEGYECALCCSPEAGVPEVEFVRLGKRK